MLSSQHLAGTLSRLQDGNDVEQIYDAVQLAYDTKGRTDFASS